MTKENTSREAAIGTLATYILGFVLSILLTITAYLLVSDHVSAGHDSSMNDSHIITLMLLAIVQLVVQAVFFLHLGRESKPRWNLTVFAFMIIVVSTVVLGSLWIMKNLDYQHGMSRTQEETNTYIVEDELLKTRKNEHSPNSH